MSSPAPACRFRITGSSGPALPGCLGPLLLRRFGAAEALRRCQRPATPPRPRGTGLRLAGQKLGNRPRPHWPDPPDAGRESPQPTARGNIRAAMATWVTDCSIGMQRRPRGWCLTKLPPDIALAIREALLPPGSFRRHRHCPWMNRGSWVHHRPAATSGSSCLCLQDLQPESPIHPQ